MHIINYNRELTRWVLERTVVGASHATFPYNVLSGQAFSIHSVINHNRGRHSRERGNSGKHWIPGQARNDTLTKIYVVIYNANELAF